MVMKVNSSCCGCFSLRTSTLLIGIIGAVGGLYLFFLSIFGPDKEDDLQTVELLREKQLNWTSEVVTTPDGPGDLAEQSEDSSFRTGHEGVAGGVQFIICIVLIIGTVKSNPSYVYPWIIVNVIIFAVSCVLYVILILFIFVAGSASAGFLFTIVLLIYAGFHAYTILVVNSFYATLTVGPINQA